ncbi:hypothetical protein [Neobacillus sp. Marseille-QA0830]
MKRALITAMAFGMMLSACQNTGPHANKSKKADAKTVQKTVQVGTTFPYPNLLAEKEGTYSLLVIGEEETDVPIEQNEQITSSVKNILSLPEHEMAEKIYPKLSILKSTTYLLFDQKGLIHESGNLENLTAYLQTRH